MCREQGIYMPCGRGLEDLFDDSERYVREESEKVYCPCKGRVLSTAH
jgi:hypothetical protein